MTNTTATTTIVILVIALIVTSWGWWNAHNQLTPTAVANLQSDVGDYRAEIMNKCETAAPASLAKR